MRVVFRKCGVLLILQFVFSFQGHTQPRDSLDIMIGQMVMVGLTDYDDPQQKELLLASIANGQVGGIILFEKDLAKTNTKKELKNLILDLQKNAPIPLFIGIDEEGGKVNRLKQKYGFPRTVSASYLGDINQEDSTRYFAASTAQLLYEVGININYAPVVDINVNPNNPIIGKVQRSFSSEPKIVTSHAQWVIDEHSKRSICTVLKHFPGHGSSLADTHLGIADVSNTWLIDELYPYIDLLKDNNFPAVMTAHIVNRTLDSTRLPATLSRKVVTGLLREQIGYKGVVFSDDMHMGAITENFGFEEAVERAIHAGVDVLMFSNNILPDEITHSGQLQGLIRKKVDTKKIAKEEIVDSYLRIIELKRNMGLATADYYGQLKIRLKEND